MPYFGNEPAKSAIKVGDNTVLSATIANGVIINEDIKSDAAIAMSKTALVAGTGITLATNTLNVDAAQTQITSVGTIGTGVWNGDVIASAYLDADTAHLSGSTFTGDVYISASGSPSFRVTDTTNTVTGKFQADNTVGKVGTHTNHSFQLFSNNTTALTIDTSQNIGIGATSISATDWGSASPVVQISGTQPLLSFKETDATKEFQLALSGGAFYLYDSDNSATRLLITDDGKVGIGCSPGFTLDVQSTGDVIAWRTSAGLLGKLGYNGNDTDNGQIVINDAGSEKIRLLANGASYFNGGNVGIGTGGSNDRLLHVQGGANSNTGVIKIEGGQPWLEMQSGANTWAMYVGDAGGGDFYIRDGDPTGGTDYLTLNAGDGNASFAGRIDAPGHWVLIAVHKLSSDADHITDETCFTSDSYVSFKIVCPWIGMTSASHLIFRFMNGSNQVNGGDYFGGITQTTHASSTIARRNYSNNTEIEVFEDVWDDSASGG